MNTITLSEQVDRLVSENQHLRVKTNNDEITRNLMKQQYDALAATVEGTRNKHEREVHLLRTERDQAVRAHREIDSLLMQAADLLVQAFRAREGDVTPEKMPVDRGNHLSDGRLPIARLS